MLKDLIAALHEGRKQHVFPEGNRYSVVELVGVTCVCILALDRLHVPVDKNASHLVLLPQENDARARSR